MDKITVLFLASDPINAARLRLGQESRDIRERLQLAKYRDKFVLESRESVRPEDITQAIFDTTPQIIHFAGHGMSTGELCFEDEQGNKQLVQPDMLARLFKELSDQIDCVVLNACYSEILAKAIAKYIPFVIGMNDSIGDKAAITFATGFYKALEANHPIEKAYNFGCVEIGIKGIPEHSKPVLHVKSNELSSSKVKWNLTLNATLDDLDEQQIEKVINYLRQISGDAALTLKKVEPGSIKLILEGSPEGFERVNSLVESGELTEVLGIEVNKDAPVIGERKEVTILFSDIRDYTSMTETLEVAEVVSLLNNYFETMVEAVFNHKGTLDKFIGDALMAVFGAPLPLENHAWLAVQCALNMCDRLAELNKHNHKVNLPTIRIGIGISSGEVAVIDPGSPRCMDYSIIDDSAHISSWLEQMTQKYRCNIILSEFTYKMCQEKVWVRELDRIRVKDRNDPFTIYELLGSRSIPLNISTEQFLNLYQIGRSAYMAMDFRKAIQYFEAAKKLKEDDRAVEIYLERANAYLISPPSKTWDGVHIIE